MLMSADRLPETAAPPPGLVVIGHYDQPQGYAINRPSGSGSWLFTWTTGGRGRLRQGRAEVRAGAGDVVVLRPADDTHPGCRCPDAPRRGADRRRPRRPAHRPLARPERLPLALPLRSPVHPAVRPVPDAGAARGTAAACRPAPGGQRPVRGTG